MRCASSFLAVLFAAGTFIGTNSARADLPGGIWTSFQHDMARTGRVEGKGAVTTPKIAWRVPTGATLRSDLSVTEVLPADVDDDGRVDVVTISAGRVHASRSDGTEMWRTETGDWTSILGVWNVDGAGGAEVFIDLNTSVAVLDARTGAVLRKLPSGQQMQGQFIPTEPSGAGIVAFQGSRETIVGYDFRLGVAAAKAIWTQTSPAQTAMLVGDVDGDGKKEFVRPLDDGFEVIEALTGKSQYRAAAIGPIAYYYSYFLANVDGKPGDEIVAFDDSYIYSPSTGVYVLGVQAGALKVLWSETDTATVPRDRDHYGVAGSAADLDGDGKIELAYARWDGAKWATRIVDAATGTVLDTIDGQVVEAVADVDGDGNAEIVARDLATSARVPSHSTLRVYDFDRSSGSKAKPALFERSRVATVSSYVRRNEAVWMSIPIFAQFNPGGGQELLVEQLSATPDASAVLQTMNADFSPLAKFSWPDGLAGAPMWFGDKLTDTASVGNIMLLATDGSMQFLKRDLSIGGSLKTGSYAGFIQALPAGGKTLVASATTTREMRFYDGSSLQPDGTPTLHHETKGVISTASLATLAIPFDPVVYLDGKTPRYVSFESSGGGLAVVARDSVTGAEAWRSKIPDGTGLVTPGGYASDLTGDGMWDLVMVTATAAGQSLSIYDGSSGALMKTAALATLVPEADQLFTGCLADLDGDGFAELIGSIHSRGVAAFKLSSASLSTLWSIPKPFGSFNGLITATQLDDDTPIDLLRVNGAPSFGQYLKMSAEGTVEVHVDPGTPALPDSDRNPVALVRRGTNTFDFVSTGMRDVGAGRVRRYAGDTLATVWTVFADSGKLTDTDPGNAAPLRAPVVADIDGDGDDDVIFGSADGWIYALDAAAGKLVFSLNVGDPVDRVISANVDGDPELEVLATVANGSLIAVDGDGRYTATVVRADAGTDDSAVSEAGSDGGVSEAGPAAPSVEGGGCGCTVVGGLSARVGALAAALALGAALWRRRKAA